LVRHGENGLLCADRDVEGITFALGRLLDDPAGRQRMGAAVRRTVIEHFDLRAAARTLAGLFEQAAATIPGPVLEAAIK
jgi:glycosyltransferase involved in cell wall biosynthesis